MKCPYEVSQVNRLDNLKRMTSKEQFGKINIFLEFVFARNNIYLMKSMFVSCVTNYNA